VQQNNEITVQMSQHNDCSLKCDYQHEFDRLTTESHVVEFNVHSRKNRKASEIIYMDHPDPKLGKD